MSLEGEEIKNKHYRRFLLSTKNLLHLDCGFVNIKSCESLRDLTSIVKNTAMTKLLDLNLVELYEDNINKDFHIHNHSFDYILNSNRDQIFYVCSHNH